MLSPSEAYDISLHLLIAFYISTGSLSTIWAPKIRLVAIFNALIGKKSVFTTVFIV